MRQRRRPQHLLSRGRRARRPEAVAASRLPERQPMFRDLIPLLADRFHVVAPDRRASAIRPAGAPRHIRPARRRNRPLDRRYRLRPLRPLCVRLRRTDGFRLGLEPVRITAIIGRTAMLMRRGLARAGYRSGPIGRTIGRQPRSAARLPDARDDRLAVHARRSRCDEGFAGRLVARQLLSHSAGRR